MDVILHLGAHRCATTSFQSYLRLNADRLRAQQIGSWGPRRTRAGLFSGLVPGPRAATGRDAQRQAIGRVQVNLQRSAESGLAHLLVSDENMMGSLRENLAICDLYCGVGERVARHLAAFDGHVTGLMLNIRSLDMYWASAMAYAATTGLSRGLPHSHSIARIAASRRGWRDVISDIASVAPGLRLQVLPFETFAGRPETQVQALTGQTVPRDHARERLSVAPRLPELRASLGPDPRLEGGDTGRWMPFDPDQAAALRETYADDIMWLTAGADGLAQLIRDPDRKQAGQTPPSQDKTRGRHHDTDQRRLAGAG